jgi:hypothetical protein
MPGGSGYSIRRIVLDATPAYCRHQCPWRSWVSVVSANLRRSSRPPFVTWVGAVMGYVGCRSHPSFLKRPLFSRAREPQRAS